MVNVIETWEWVALTFIVLGFIWIFWITAHGKPASYDPDADDYGRTDGVYTAPDYEDGEWR